MDKSRISTVAAEAVLHTCEEMAFTLLCQVAVSPEKDPHSSVYQAELPVLSPFKGIFTLTIAPNLLKEMTESIYGLENEITYQMVEDTIAEILNTISGRVMHDLTPTEQTFELGLPVLGGEPGAIQEPVSLEEWFFESEDGELLIFSLAADFSR